MRKISFKKFLPGIAWFFIVLLLTCLPGDDIPKVGWLDKIYFDKWVHAGLFGGLAFLFSFPFFESHLSSKQKVKYFIRIAIAASVIGLTIEFIQKYLVTARSFDLVDWAADSVGAFIAFWFCRTKINKPSSSPDL